MNIHLENAARRDAEVEIINISPSRRVRAVDPATGQDVKTVRLMLTTASQKAVEAFTAESIINADHEISDVAGVPTGETQTVYVNGDGEVVAVGLTEVKCAPDSAVLSRAPYKPNEVTDRLPWGALIPLSDAVRRFAFCGAVQITHRDGLTFDFLYDIAKKLADTQSMLFIKRVVLRHDGTAYKGFLEGRIEGKYAKKYALILHLSQMELKEVRNA